MWEIVDFAVCDLAKTMQRFLTTLQFFRSAGYVVLTVEHRIFPTFHTSLNEGGISLILLIPQVLRVGSC
jgi:hypothetical protein